jgi:enoyl-[acyl-carrier protein] reductase III
MAIEVRGKRALVTGGSRGIGRAIALCLAEAGADVAINYLRNVEAARDTVAAIRSAGVEALAVKANVADEDGVSRLFDELGRGFGHLDIVVSNAASGVLKSALELTRRHWHWTMDINAGALLPLVQRAIPLMGQGGGKVIAVSSLGATRAIPNYAAVGASKAALESLVRHLAIELAPKGINVNAVSAGIVDTDALKHFPHREQMLAHTRARTPAGRLTEPDDIAQVVLFLASAEARMIHGQVVVVDGGYSILA